MLHESRPSRPWLIFDVRQNGPHPGAHVGDRIIRVHDPLSFNAFRFIVWLTWRRHRGIAGPRRCEFLIDSSVACGPDLEHASVHASSTRHLLFRSWYVPLARRVRPMNEPPNKAPEPTSCSVTSRAIVPLVDLKQQNPSRLQARVAPEQAVAHL
jgi:hypothetical protein